jgi:sialate O-acetylesterase
MFRKTSLLLSLLLWAFSLSSGAEVGLHRLISDGMVLQRNTEVPIRGRAAPGEAVTVSFREQTYDTTADKAGEWRIRLPEMAAGGPYTLTVSAGTTVTVEDILIGDVWLASGQSNMELPMRRVKPRYPEAIESADHPRIRHFDVPDRFNFKKPETDLDGGHWATATPENVLDFSAIGYFFARALQREHDVPVGIINASLGGSPAQAWLSEQALKEFPDYYKQALRFRDDTLIERIQENDEQRINEWHQTLDRKDPGKQGEDYPWAGDGVDTKDWARMTVPGYWSEDKGNGVFWFRKAIELPEELAGQPARLNLGRIVDADTAFINGTAVGSTGYQYPPRWYEVPEGVLKTGANTIAVRVISERGRGGFVPDKDYELKAGGRRFDLSGQWLYRKSADMPRLEQQTFIRWKPMGLFNGMIAPLTHHPIKGVIWYQGESNTGRPAEYHDLFSRLIADWRDQWDHENLPFLYVQLANFLDPAAEPGDNNWARLREAQLETLSVPHTGMAVTIDIGEWNDIHPLNKKDVAERLAAAARSIAYGEELVHSGPVYRSMKRKGDTIVLSFDHVDGGLTVNNGERLHEFTIAGPDRRFARARAEIRGNKVRVWHPDVKNPVAVRYAWADNPDRANLYNKAGFPASPFRTDNW